MDSPRAMGLLGLPPTLLWMVAALSWGDDSIVAAGAMLAAGLLLGTLLATALDDAWKMRWLEDTGRTSIVSPDAYFPSPPAASVRRSPGRWSTDAVLRTGARAVAFTLWTYATCLGLAVAAIAAGVGVAWSPIALGLALAAVGISVILWEWDEIAFERERRAHFRARRAESGVSITGSLVDRDGGEPARLAYRRVCTGRRLVTSYADEEVEESWMELLVQTEGGDQYLVRGPLILLPHRVRRVAGEGRVREARAGAGARVRVHGHLDAAAGTGNLVTEGPYRGSAPLAGVIDGEVRGPAQVEIL